MQKCYLGVEWFWHLHQALAGSLGNLLELRGADSKVQIEPMPNFYVCKRVSLAVVLYLDTWCKCCGSTISD